MLIGSFPHKNTLLKSTLYLSLWINTFGPKSWSSFWKICRMSLQLKLNLMISCLLLLLLAASAIFVVKNASEDVRAEVTSTANLALHLLDAEISHYNSDLGWINSSETTSVFRLQSLENVRHLKIDFFDNNGILRETNRIHDHQLAVDAPPL